MGASANITANVAHTGAMATLAVLICAQHDTREWPLTEVGTARLRWVF
jgi:hypothetical protein